MLYCDKILSGYGRDHEIAMGSTPFLQQPLFEPYRANARNLVDTARALTVERSKTNACFEGLNSDFILEYTLARIALHENPARLESLFEHFDIHDPPLDRFSPEEQEHIAWLGARIPIAAKVVIHESLKGLHDTLKQQLFQLLSAVDASEACRRLNQKRLVSSGAWTADRLCVRFPTLTQPKVELEFQDLPGKQTALYEAGFDIDRELNGAAVKKPRRIHLERLLHLEGIPLKEDERDDIQDEVVEDLEERALHTAYQEVARTVSDRWAWEAIRGLAQQQLPVIYGQALDLGKIEIYCEDRGQTVADSRLLTEDPQEAEAQYFRLCKVRTAGEGCVLINSERPFEVVNAAFRTDIKWEGPREQVYRRQRQVWAMGKDRDGPTPYQMRGLAAAWHGGRHGAQKAMANAIGVTGKTWRDWAKLAGRRPTMPAPAWFGCLVLADVLDDHGPRQKHVTRDG